MIKIPIEVSARHVHISEGDLKELFGKEIQLKEIKKLSQPNEFVSEQTVTLKTEKDQIEKVRILGPCRQLTQVEISQTDAYRLGLNPPIKECTRSSGEMAALITICNGEKCLERAAAIIAQRHIHFNPQQAKEINVKDNENVSIKISGKKSLTFHNVLIRVEEDFEKMMHIDTDEANAAGILGNGEGELIK